MLSRDKPSGMLIVDNKTNAQLLQEKRERIAKIEDEYRFTTSKDPNHYFNLEHINFLIDERLKGHSPVKTFKDLREKFGLSKAFTDDAGSRSSYHARALLADNNVHPMVKAMAEVKLLDKAYENFYCNSTTSAFINRLVRIGELVIKANQSSDLANEFESKNMELINENAMLIGETLTVSQLREKGFMPKQIAEMKNMKVAAVNQRIKRGT